MAGEFEQMFREIFGEPLSKLTQLQGQQLQKITAKVQDLAREALKDDLSRMTTEIADLRNRLASLEAERARAAAESIEPL